LHVLHLRELQAFDKSEAAWALLGARKTANARPRIAPTVGVEPTIAHESRRSRAISTAVARAAIEEGWNVLLTARTKEAAERTAATMKAPSGRLLCTAADAPSSEQVKNAFVQAKTAFGQVNAVFNGIGGRPTDLGYPAASLETPLADFMVPMTRIVQSQFLTAREAAKYMGIGGAIVMLSATLSGMTARHMAGITAACGAIEALTRALAGDFGALGIRVNCVRGSAMPETRTIAETFGGLSALGSAPQIVAPPLGRPITVDDTAKAAMFVASDRASGMTGQILTVCAGAFV
jgi:3-oxoacyl-[acyl-carrier protein] reductase